MKWHLNKCQSEATPQIHHVHHLHHVHDAVDFLARLVQALTTDARPVRTRFLESIVTWIVT